MYDLLVYDCIQQMRVANKAVDVLESIYNTDYDVGSPAVILCRSNFYTYIVGQHF